MGDIEFIGGGPDSGRSAKRKTKDTRGDSHLRGVVVRDTMVVGRSSNVRGFIACDDEVDRRSVQVGRVVMH
jgi:hypothetical protein